MRDHLTQAGTTLLVILTLATACVGDGPREPQLPNGPLVIDEVMSDNDASWLDDALETEDFIELVNVSHEPLALKGYTLRDGSGKLGPLPAQTLAPGARIVLFADAQTEQGVLHLPWKLDAGGERLELLDPTGELIDRVDIPALETNQAYARFPSGHGKLQTCRYATPEQDNGERCGPPAPLPPPNDTTWQPFTWPTPASPSAPAGPLVLSELALLPASFVEVMNTSGKTITLADYELHLDATGPGLPWPTASESKPIAWGATKLAPGARLAVPLTAADTAAIAATEAFEGVATIFDVSGGADDTTAIARVDFMRWPRDAVLTRIPDADGSLRFCDVATRGEANDDCDPLQSRDVGDRVRHLYTPGDYAALAQGDTQLGSTGVKFVVDMESGDAVHLLGTKAWALHYTWIREKIDGEPPLDRCDRTQATEFDNGWFAFSQKQYFAVDTRRYLLGMLDTYAGSDAKTVDYTLGDQISAAQMKRGFLAVMGHVDTEDVRAWSLRPNEPRQVTELRKIEGQVPIVSQNAPFQGLRYQPLTSGVAFGTLVFESSDVLETAALGPHTIVVTDGVPNDIPFVAGLITEAFQTPLAHVNVLSQNRGTPNMALRDARHAKELEPLLGKLVELHVEGTSFTLKPASNADADAFWKSREPSGPRVAPRLDTSERGVIDLRGRGLADLPKIGAKAAQLAEVGNFDSAVSGCTGAIPKPDLPFAIPLVHYVEHFEKCGAAKLLVELTRDADFRVDPEQREAGLARIRKAILKAPVDAKLLAQVRQAVSTRYGDVHVRFRSSSNTEDLPGFNGAGLYESWNGELNDPKNTIEDAIRNVWASLWSLRAYDEREFGHIDQTKVAMGVLVHPAFLSEQANVIAISRDVFDPTRADVHYMNAQLGEASVALPAPGVTTEQLRFHARFIKDTPRLEYQSTSSLSHGKHVLDETDATRVSCLLTAIHSHFQAVLDPLKQNRWFAMDVELKVVGPNRDVFVKQARPYSFTRVDIPSDCREF